MGIKITIEKSGQWSSFCVTSYAYPMHIRTFSKLSGVSIATVSRAFSGKGRIKDETRERILRLAAKHGFTPNIHARRLSSRQSSTLGIFYSFSSKAIFDYYNLELAQELASAALEVGYATQMEFSNALDKQQERLHQLVANRGLDGVVLVSDGETGAKTLLSGMKTCPSVVISTTPWPDSPSMGVVHLNFGPGIDAALDHLVKEGHTRIGYIRGKADEAKLDSYLRFMERQGIKVKEGWVGPGCSTFAEGGDAAEKMARLKLTALLCATDILALGALNHLNGAGLRVPGDMSIIGIDDLAFSAYVTPPLSSIGVPRAQLAKAAVEILTRAIRDIRDGQSQPRYQHTVNAAFTARKSSGGLARPPITVC